MAKRLGISIGMGALALAVIAAGLWLWEQRPMTVDPARYENKARDYTVTITRDRWGIPHVHGPRDADAAFGLAYAHAEDDFGTIQDVMIAIRGELASVKGPKAAPGDYLVRMMRIWERVDAGYDALPESTRAIAEGYADGLNLWAARNPKAVIRGFLPARGKDVVAGFVFKTRLFYGLDKALKEITGPDRAKPIAAPPSAFLQEPERAPWGSNAIAVAPSRSDDGSTRLWVNSHQPLSGPVAWYEAHLSSDEGLDVYGGVFPGAPVILHGFNQRIGWANTVNHPDLYDVYVLDVNPENQNEYKLDGEWRAFEPGVARIEVKLFGALRWTFERPLLRSAHGPVLSTDHGTYALRYVGMDEIRQLDQYHQLNRAQNLEEFMAAMRLHTLPSINYTYADQDGHIAYIYNARFPVRERGWDWQAYLPGDRSSLIWKAFAPFESIPQLVDPAAGFVGNANHTPFAATADPDNLDPADFPPEWGIERWMTNRGHRLLEQWGSDESITRDEMIAYKFDHRYSENSRAAKLITQLRKADLSDNELLSRAQQILGKWDLDTGVENKNAAVGVLTLDRALRTHDDRSTLPAPEKVRAALEETARELETHFGRLDPEWGDVNRLRRGAVDLPVSGAPDVLRAIYGAPKEGDGTRTATNGDGFMALVEWSSSGERRAWGLHQYGVHVTDPAAPHGTDQMQPFVGEELRPLYITPELLAENTERSYSP
ncbi:MAG: penicillin acylase family protein [Myxococcota bacterium]